MGTVKKYLTPVLIILVLVAGGAAGWFYKQLREVRQNPQAVAQKINAELVAKVGQLIVLPEGEQPTIATITDVETLKDQPFFEHAKNGYDVLIYTNAKKAILYDPVRNKIVDVAPLNIGAPTGTPSGATAKPTTPPALK